MCLHCWDDSVALLCVIDWPTMAATLCYSSFLPKMNSNSRSFDKLSYAPVVLWQCWNLCIGHLLLSNCSPLVSCRAHLFSTALWFYLPMRKKIRDEIKLVLSNKEPHLLMMRWCTNRSSTRGTVLRSSGATIGSCWSSPRSQGFSGSRTRARDSGRCCKRCTLLDTAAGSCSTNSEHRDEYHQDGKGTNQHCVQRELNTMINLKLRKTTIFYICQMGETASVITYWGQDESLTSGSCWKITTRPPLSPVASSSPEWLNSTVDMMSAVDEVGQLKHH